MSQVVTSDPVTALRGALDDLERTIASFSPEQYAIAPAPGFASGVGPHVRHVLDHVEALVDAIGRDGEIDYDARKRGTPEEHDRLAGLSRLADLRDRLEVLSHDHPGHLDRACEVRVLVDPDSPPRRVPSSWTRETLYVFQHTVHHLALMSAIAGALGVPIAEEIGRAPSTRAEDRRRSCAR